jgi:proteic killer suppression protein
MIKTFRCKETEKIFNGMFSKKLPQDIQRTAHRKLALLNAAATLEFLNASPGNKLEALKGNREEQYSIRVNDQWRICFVWENGNALDVVIEDYHS